MFSIRMPSLDPDLSLPLICDLYVSHPSVSDNTGRGVAKLILADLVKMGFSNANLRVMLKGGCFDGGMFNLNVSN